MVNVTIFVAYMDPMGSEIAKHVGLLFHPNHLTQPWKNERNHLGVVPVGWRSTLDEEPRVVPSFTSHLKTLF